MATKSATLRGILSLINDVGESPSCDLDESLSLSGYKKIHHDRFPLAAAAADEAMGITEELIGVIIFSHDYPFSLRMKAAEKQVTNTRLFVIWGDDQLDAAYDGLVDDILLSGDGSNEADIEAYLITKP